CALYMADKSRPPASLDLWHDSGLLARIPGCDLVDCADAFAGRRAGDRFMSRPQTHQETKKRTRRCASLFPAIRTSSLRAEFHLDLRGLLNELPVQLGRFKLPLPHGFKRRVLKNRQTADELQVGHLTVLGNGALDGDGAAQAANFGDRRINRSHPLD